MSSASSFLGGPREPLPCGLGTTAGGREGTVPSFLPLNPQSYVYIMTGILSGPLFFLSSRYNPGKTKEDAPLTLVAGCSSS